MKNNGNVSKLASGLLLLDKYTEKVVCWGDEDAECGIIVYCDRLDEAMDKVLLALRWRYCIFTKAYCFDTDNYE